MPTLLLDIVVVYKLVMLTLRGQYSIPMSYPAQPTMPMTMFSQPNLFPANTISAAIPANAVQPPEDSRPRLLDGPVMVGLGYGAPPENNRTARNHHHSNDGSVAVVAAGMGYPSEGGGGGSSTNEDHLIDGFGGLSLSGSGGEISAASAGKRYPGFHPQRLEGGGEEDGDRGEVDGDNGNH